MIHAERLNQCTPAGPAWVQWALGSDWSAATRVDRSPESLPPPNSSNIRLEVVHDAADSLTVIGAPQPPAACPRSWVQRVAQATAPNNDPWHAIQAGRIVPAPLDRLTLGVFNRWLESPRVERAPTDGSIAAVADAIVAATDAFAPGTTRPIIAEFWSADVPFWIAVGVSANTSRGHAIDSVATANALARLRPAWVGSP